MVNTDNNPSIPVTNPLQNNNAVITLVAYLSGIAAAKLPIFDFATWNYIFMSLLGVLAVVTPYIFNRKSAVISTVANLPEVKKDNGIILDKSVPSAIALAQDHITPSNVVVK